MTASYWEIGRRIVEFEQGGEGRAAYGDALIQRLGTDLAQRFGRGFGRRNLAQMRAFYLAWPIDQILQTLSAKSPSIPVVLGDDFAFIGRQRRLRIDDSWFRVDLVFFHRRL